MCVCLRESMRSVCGGLTTGLGRCHVCTELSLPLAEQAEQEVGQMMPLSLVRYLSYPKFAGAKRMVVS